MINGHFCIWKSDEVYPIWATPNCVFGFPQSNDFQKITLYKNQFLPSLFSLPHPCGAVSYEQNHNSYPRLISEAKGGCLRPLEAIGFNIKYLIFIFLINKFIN